jgi:hypothetical protein
MSTLTTSLENAQDLILDYLRSVPALSGHGVEWISRKEGKLLNDIDAGRSQLGLACFVYPVAPVGCNPNLRGPVFDRLQIRVTWFENHSLNHDGALHADEAALLTAQCLHQLSVLDQGLHLVTAQEDSPMEWSLTRQGLQQWDCWFNCQLSISQVPRVPRPCIAYDAGTEAVTITCSDAEATLYYTTDGSFPYPENPQVQTYADPLVYTGVEVTYEGGDLVYGGAFSAPGSTHIRAIAIRDGQAPSNLISIILSEI